MALRVGELFTELKLDSRGFEQGVKSAEKGMVDVARQSENTEGKLRDVEKQSDRTGGGLQKLGNAFRNVAKLAAVGAAATIAAMTGVGIAAFQVGKRFDAAYDTIAIGTGATGKALNELEADFKAVVSNVPTDFETASGAIANLNTTVGATGEVLQDLTTSVLNASRMLGEDGVANAEAFGQAMRQWNIPAEEGTELMDDLFRLTQDYGIGLGELIGQLNAYGPVMKNAGFSTGETAELMARLNAEGIDWSRISPGLNASFRRWAEAGKEPREELGRVIEAMQNAETDVDALNLATAAFGAEGAQRMTTAIRNGTFTLDDLGEILGDNAGLVNDLAGETDDLGEKWTLLKNRAMVVFEPIANAVFNLAGAFMDWLLPISERVFPVIERHLESVAEAFAGYPQVIDRVVGRFRELLNTAGAFRGWVSAILSDGGILNNYLSMLPGWFQGMVETIDGMMRGAGMTAIRTYAQGIIDGANGYITQAVNYVASLISAYLVGQSPPPEGPLSEIDQAGQNLMETYTDGMVEGAKGAEDAAGRVADALDMVDEGAQLDAGREGLEAATGNLEEMEAVSGDVESKIQDINRELAEIDLELLDIDRAVADINDKYDDQLEPLNEQLRLLERQRDLSAEKLQLETDLARTQAQAAALEALGDPERRSEIAGEMALNDLQQQRLDNEQAIAGVRAQLEGGGEELTEAERERLELRERDLELQRRETQSKLNSDKELTALEKQRLQLKLDQIDADLRANRSAQNATPEEMTAAERERLELQLRELELRGELLAMIDAEAAAQAEADTALIDSRQKEKDLIEEIADIQNEITKIPILEEIEKVEEARRAELEPLELQRAALEEQKEDLDYLRQHWQFLAGDVGAALEPLREAARLQEQIARDAERAAKAGGGGGLSVPDGPSGGGGAGDAGLDIPEMPDFATPDAPDTPEMEPLEIPAVVVPGADGDTLTLDMLAPKPEPLGEKFGRLFADGAIARIGEVIRQNLGRVMGASIGAALGGALLSPLGLAQVGAAIGGVLGSMIGSGVQGNLEENPIDFSGWIEGIQEKFDEHIRPVFDRFREWLAGGQENVQGFGDTVRGIFDNWIAPTLQRISSDILPAFSQAWRRIQPTIEPAIRNIGRLVEWVYDLIDVHWGSIMRVVEPIWRGVARVVTDSIGQASRVIATVLQVIGGDWEGAWNNVKDYLKTTWELIRDIVSTGIRLVQKFIDDALPVIWAKLKEWGAAFWDWVEPQIGPMIEELGKLLYDLGEWIVTEALPVIWEKLQEWGSAFIDWVGPKIPDLLDELWSLLTQLSDWIWGTAAPAIVEKLLTWGAAFIDWVGPKIPVLLEKVGELLTDLGNWIKDDAAPEIIEKLLTWGAAFLDWIQDEVLPYIIEKAGDISSSILTWITDTALPEIIEKLKTWAAAFLDFVKDEVLPYLGDKLGDVLTAITDWVTDSLSDVKTAVKDIGEAIVEGIWEGITGLGGWFKDKVGGFVTDNVPDFIKDKLMSDSPAKVMIPIGADVVRGMMAGLASQEQALQERVGSMADTMVRAGRNGVRIPVVSSEMAIPAAATVGSAASTGVAQERSGGRGQGATTVVVPINVGGREAERWVIDVVNGQARKVY